jgi:hypothetical protein
LTHNLLFDRTVEIVPEGKAMERHPVETGVPQGSPVLSVLFEIYTAGLIVKREKLGAESLFFVDDIRWIAN